MTTQEMIKRYIYDVARRLPSEQRDDISRELRSLIDDMMEERAENGKTEQENAEMCIRDSEEIAHQIVYHLFTVLAGRDTSVCKYIRKTVDKGKNSDLPQAYRRIVLSGLQSGGNGRKYALLKPFLFENGVDDGSGEFAEPV